MAGIYRLFYPEPRPWLAPFFLALFSGQIDKLPRSGEWMIWVKKPMGWVLVGMAAYFIRPILPKTAGIFLLAAVAFAAGLHLGWIDRTKASFRAFDWIRNGMVIISVIITTILIGEKHAKSQILSQ